DAAPQQVLIGRKSLEQALPADSANNSDQVGRLHPIVDKIGQHLPNEEEVLAPYGEVVYYECEYPPHVRFPETLCSALRRLPGNTGLTRSKRRPCIHKLEEADELLLATIVKLKIIP